MTLKRLDPLIPLLFAALSTLAQQPSTTSNPISKDPQAIAILNQSLSAVGGLTAISGIQDYTGTGNITYYWAGQEVQGSVTVRGMGTSNFRLDAVLPDGTRTWAASGYVGVLIHQDGTRKQTAFYNLMTAGSMTLPFIRIAAALNDPSTGMSLVGASAAAGAQIYQVHIIPPVINSAFTGNSMPGLGSFDVFIDPASLLPTKLSEQARSELNPTITVLHEIEFQNFQITGNLKVPMTINEKINGQLVSTITLTSVSFNSGLAQADFMP